MTTDEQLLSPHPIVPPKGDDPAKDFIEERSYHNLDDALDAFVDAKERLLIPNRWHELAGTFSAEFQLNNAEGTAVNRAAKTGDLICIHVPGPSGMTPDWVRIEEITYDDYPDDSREVVALRVRPTSDPRKTSDETKHFFSSDATSSWIVEREGTTLRARYHGRHETPNKEGEGLLQKARDVITAVAGLLGFSDIQWKSLLNGLLDGKS